MLLFRNDFKGWSCRSAAIDRQGKMMAGGEDYHGEKGIMSRIGRGARWVKKMGGVDDERDCETLGSVGHIRLSPIFESIDLVMHITISASLIILSCSSMGSSPYRTQHHLQLSGSVGDQRATRRS